MLSSGFRIRSEQCTVQEPPAAGLWPSRRAPRTGTAARRLPRKKRGHAGLERPNQFRGTKTCVDLMCTQPISSAEKPRANSGLDGRPEAEWRAESAGGRLGRWPQESARERSTSIPYPLFESSVPTVRSAITSTI